MMSHRGGRGTERATMALSAVIVIITIKYIPWQKVLLKINSSATAAAATRMNGKMSSAHSLAYES